MTSAMKGVVTVCAAIAFVLTTSCGNSTAPTSTRDISGTWALTTNISNAQLQETCTITGSVVITQSGTNFTGQVTGSTEVCTGPGGTNSSSADGALTGGQINGNSVNYSGGQCTYTGDITGSPANRVQGNVNCNFPIGGTTYPFDGTWQISR